MEIIRFFFDDPEHFIGLAVALWLIFPIWRTKCDCKHDARSVTHDAIRPKESEKTRKANRQAAKGWRDPQARRN